MNPTQTPDGTQLPNRSDEGGPELPSRTGERPGPELPPRTGERPGPEMPRRQGAEPGREIPELPPDPDVPPPDTPHIVPSVPGSGGTDVPTSPEPGLHV